MSYAPVQLRLNIEQSLISIRAVYGFARAGHSKPLAEKPRGSNHRLVDSLPILDGRLSDPAMTFRREDI